MFEFLRKQQEYISCKWLEYGINFTHEGISNCCMYAHNDNNNETIIPLNPDNTYNYEKFIEQKKYFKEQHRQGNIIKRCENCPFLRLKKWDNDFHIKQLIINTSTRCNADCIYCFTHKDKEYFNKFKDIPIYEFIKTLKSKKIITDNISVIFGGGEPVLNSEFEKLTELFLNCKKSKIKIYSSGIQYSTVIEKCLRKGNCELVITPDSGTKELYQKIKNTDKFDDVWNNIQKYVEAQNENKTQVRTKYIIIPEVNDNESAINEFFNKVIETGVKYVKPEIEYNSYLEIKNSKEKLTHIFYLLKYMEQYCDNHKISHGVAGNMYCAQNEFHSLYDSVK